MEIRVVNRVHYQRRVGYGHRVYVVVRSVKQAGECFQIIIKGGWWA